MGERCKNVISGPKNGRHFPKSRSFEIKFADNMPLTLSKTPTKICWNDQNRFGGKCVNVILDPKNDRHFPRSRSFEVKFADNVFLPSFIAITKADLEKSEKM